MKTVLELDKAILTITMKIHDEYPELSKYIKEMPVNNLDKQGNGKNLSDLKDYYNSLKAMLETYSKTHAIPSIKDEAADVKLEGYPLYPPADDIYKQGIVQTEINPSDLSKQKTPNEKAENSNEKELNINKSGSDLDVPGSELDDKQEQIGSEDEENNYYSLGGNNHIDLDENDA